MNIPYNSDNACFSRDFSTYSLCWRPQVALKKLSTTKLKELMYETRNSDRQLSQAAADEINKRRAHAVKHLNPQTTYKPFDGDWGWA